jgi:hypothetical protein
MKRYREIVTKGGGFSLDVACKALQQLATMLEDNYDYIVFVAVGEDGATYEPVHYNIHQEAVPGTGVGPTSMPACGVRCQ